MNGHSQLETLLTELADFLAKEGQMTPEIQTMIETFQTRARTCLPEDVNNVSQEFGVELWKIFHQDHPFRNDVRYLETTLFEHGGKLHLSSCDGTCKVTIRQCTIDAVYKLLRCIKLKGRLSDEIKRDLEDLVSTACFIAPEVAAHTCVRLAQVLARNFPPTDPDFEEFKTIFEQCYARAAMDY